MFLGEEEDSSVNMDEEVFLSDAYFSIACFCIKPSVFFFCVCLVALLYLFPFPKIPLSEFALSTSPWSLLDSIRKGILITVSEWTCFLFPASVVSAPLFPLIEKSNITENRYDNGPRHERVNLFFETRWCRDKRQGKKEDGGLGSSLVRVD